MHCALPASLVSWLPAQPLCWQCVHSSSLEYLPPWKGSVPRSTCYNCSSCSRIVLKILSHDLNSVSQQLVNGDLCFVTWFVTRLGNIYFFLFFFFFFFTFFPSSKSKNLEGHYTTFLVILNKHCLYHKSIPVGGFFFSTRRKINNSTGSWLLTCTFFSLPA